MQTINNLHIQYEHWSGRKAWYVHDPDNRLLAGPYETEEEAMNYARNNRDFVAGHAAHFRHGIK